MSLVRERQNWEDQVTLAVREIGQKRMSGTYTTQNRRQWRVFCPRLIPFGHSDMFSVRDFGITWLRIEHRDVISVQDFGIIWLRIGQSDVFPVRGQFNSDTVTCFLSEILELHDPESNTGTCFLSKILELHDSESDRVTCFLSEVNSIRTQWHVFCSRFWNYMTQNRTQGRVFCPRFWNYMTQNRTEWRVFCPRFISIAHSDMFSLRDFGITWLRIEHRDVISVQDFGITWLRIGQSDVVPVRDLFQSDTVTCFLSEILELHDSIGHSDVLCPRFIPVRHSGMFSVRDVGVTRLRIGHSDLLYVREFGHPSPVTIKYVIIFTRDVSLYKHLFPCNKNRG